MRRLYRQGLTTTSGGNISRRAGADRVVLTASKFDKGVLRAEQVGVLALDGTNLTPELAPSIEASLHLEIYRRHPGVAAIVHAHPPAASAFCATARRIDCHLTAEPYAILGEPVYLDYARMGSADLARIVAAGLTGAACALMANHGAITVGASLLEAFDRVEVLEMAARQTLMVAMLGAPRALDAAQLAELDRFMGRG